MTNPGVSKSEFDAMLAKVRKAGYENLGSFTFGVLYEGVRLGMLPADEEQRREIGQEAIHTGYMADREAARKAAEELPDVYSRNAHDLLYLVAAEPDWFTEGEKFAEAANMRMVIVSHLGRLETREQRLLKTREELSTTGANIKFAGWVAAMGIIGLSTAAGAEALDIGNPALAGTYAMLMSYLTTQLVQFQLYKKGSTKSLGIMEHAAAAEKLADARWSRSRTLVEDGWAADDWENAAAGEDQNSVALKVSRAHKIESGVRLNTRATAARRAITP